MSLAFWLVYAIAGFGSVVFELVRTGHAKRGAKGERSQDGGCWDGRVWKLVAVLGGAASFSFGWPYFVLSSAAGIPSWLAEMALVYGAWQFVLSGIQTAIFLVDTVRKKKIRELRAHFPRLKAHWGRKFGRRGCGSSTARSPFWFLYWIANRFSADSLAGKIVGVTRDGITLIDVLASLPAILVLDAITAITVRVIWLPVITSVDQES